MWRPYGPHRTPYLHPASTARPASCRCTINIKRSFSSRLQCLSEQQCHQCACSLRILTHRSRKTPSRTLIVALTHRQFSFLRTLPILTTFKIHNSNVPKRLPSSRRIDNAPASRFPHYRSSSRRSVPDTALRLHRTNARTPVKEHPISEWPTIRSEHFSQVGKRCGVRTKPPARRTLRVSQVETFPLRWRSVWVTRRSL
jgi:hypothetical protein